jgi:hypothetical protein
VPVAAGEIMALRRAALDEGAWLHVVDDPTERVQLAELAGPRTGPSWPTRRSSPSSSGGRPSRRGVPTACRHRGRPAPPPPGPVGAAGLRRLLGRHATFVERPAVVVLTSHLSGRAADVGAGQALQRVLLTATADGLAASFLSQLVELPGPRKRLRRLVRGAQLPQAVLRIGHGFPVPATPRRPLAEVVGLAVASTGA